MIDVGIAFFIGFVIGLVLKPKDKTVQELEEEHKKKVIQYEIDLAYYRQLCKWHVERAKEK